MSSRSALVGILALVVGALGTPAAGQQRCGSALLAEAAAPAVFDGLQLDPETVARFWEAGAAATSFGSAGCLVGCTNATGPMCTGGSECVAITGVNWLNSISCAVAGHAPPRTVFLIEQATADAGGQWAAINLASNPSNSNYDLDSLAQVVCGGCSSVASPYLGGGGSPVVETSSITDGVLSASLSWTAPSSMAQLLSDGDDLLTSYAVYYRPDDLGNPPPATGEKTGWALLQDLDPDGAGNSGYSTNTTAEVAIPLEGPIEELYFAVGLSFDGSGDPSVDGNTVESAFLSDLSLPVAVPPPCGGTNHLTLDNQTVSSIQEFVACFTITAGDNFVVGSTGDVTFRAGFMVVLDNGFSVESDGIFGVVLDQALTEF